MVFDSEIDSKYRKFLTEDPCSYDESKDLYITQEKQNIIKISSKWHITKTQDRVIYGLKQAQMTHIHGLLGDIENGNSEKATAELERKTKELKGKGSRPLLKCFVSMCLIFVQCH